MPIVLPVLSLSFAQVKTILDAIAPGGSGNVKGALCLSFTNNSGGDVANISVSVCGYKRQGNNSEAWTPSVQASKESNTVSLPGTLPITTNNQYLFQDAIAAIFYNNGNPQSGLRNFTKALLTPALSTQSGLSFLVYQVTLVGTSSDSVVMASATQADGDDGGFFQPSPPAKPNF